MRVATDDEKLRALNLLCNRLYRSFSLYYLKTRIYPMLQANSELQVESSVILAVKDACVEAVLMSIRDLDDFFQPRTEKTRHDDLRATDFFGYQSSGSFLSGTERNSINQWIAHLTYQPVWTGTTGVSPDIQKNWNTVELIGKAARSVFDFLII